MLHYATPKKKRLKTHRRKIAMSSLYESSLNFHKILAAVVLHPVQPTYVTLHNYFHYNKVFLSCQTFDKKFFSLKFYK